MKFSVIAKALLLAGCTAVCSAAVAQSSFPQKRVTLVVPYSAGGVTDLFARSLGAQLARIWGQPVVVENREGAGTIIGTQLVSRAPADGYTLLFTSYAYTSNPLLRKQLPYGRDAFRPVGLLGSSHNVLLVAPAHKNLSLPGVLALAQQPGGLKLASSGAGSSPHIGAELFAQKAGITFTHIPYKGQGPAMTDLMAGVVDGMFDGMSSYSVVQADKVHAVAIAAKRRHPAAPDLPTFQELGMDFVSGSWFGMLAPAATPDGVVQKINRDMNQALQDSKVQAQISKTGMVLSTGSPEEFGRFLSLEKQKLQGLLDSGVRIDLN